MFQLSNSKWEENIRTHNALPEDELATAIDNGPQIETAVELVENNKNNNTNPATPDTTATTTTSLSPGRTGDGTEENSADDEDSCGSGNISRGNFFN